MSDESYNNDIYLFQLFNGHVDYVGGSAIDMVCDCGSKDGELCIDPFAEEIYGKLILCYMCKDCYYNRCMEV